MKYNPDEIEKFRCNPSAQLRDAGDSVKKIVGYAAVFNTWTDIGGWFKESIKPGAFSKTIKENDIRALMNHNENYVLGRNKSGTLKLREDDLGLAVEIDPVPATWALDLIASMKRGDVSQMSFGFTVNKQSMNYETDERILEDVTLFDVSVVTFPAYPTTSAQVRSAFQKKMPPDDTPPPFENLDFIINKVKAGEELSEDELRILREYIPNLFMPPEKHMETPPPPPEQHAGDDTRKGIDRVARLITQAELITN